MKKTKRKWIINSNKTSADPHSLNGIVLIFVSIAIVPFSLSTYLVCFSHHSLCVYQFFFTLRFSLSVRTDQRLCFPHEVRLCERQLPKLQFVVIGLSSWKGVYSVPLPVIGETGIRFHLLRHSFLHWKEKPKRKEELKEAQRITEKSTPERSTERRVLL